MEPTSGVVLEDNYGVVRAGAPANRQPGVPGVMRLAVLVVAIPMTAGCGPSATLVGTEIETQIAEGLADQVGGDFAVTCPSPIPAEAGYTFTCEVADRTGGTTVTVQVVEDGGDGAFTWTVVSPSDVAGAE